MHVVLMGRSAENQRVGNVTIAAWQMEERADQRMSVGRLPDSINGRVRGAGRDEVLCNIRFKISFPVCKRSRVLIFSILVVKETSTAGSF